MTDLPLLGIVFVTYKRTTEALRSIRSVSENLVYPKDKIGWFINDDGSPTEHVDVIKNLFVELNEKVVFMNTERFGGATYFCGKGWNLALEKAYEFSEIVLFIEDDWVLPQRLDISNYVQLLVEREDVGMLRLGTLAIGNILEVDGYKGVHYFKYSRNCSYAYSGNPSLRHHRFTKTYGWFAEDRHPGHIELNYDDKFRANAGPDIWRPGDISPWGAFGHIGTDKSYREE